MASKRILLSPEDVVKKIQQGGWTTPCQKIFRDKKPENPKITYADSDLIFEQAGCKHYLTFLVGGVYSRQMPADEIFYHEDKPWTIYVCKVTVGVYINGQYHPHARHMQTTVELHHWRMKADHDSSMQALLQGAVRIIKFPRFRSSPQNTDPKTLLAFLQKLVGRTICDCRLSEGVIIVNLDNESQIQILL